MKKIVSLLLVISLLLCSTLVFAEELPSPSEGLRSKNILLMDRTSGRIIYEKDYQESINPGGFAKILTAAIAMDFVNSLDERVTANAKAVTTYDFSFNNMGILPGESMTVTQLLYGLLLYDAGEAANVLAVYCGDSIEKFVEKMNNTAQKIGCTSTHFTNPSGLPDSNQYTTLEDVAKIVEYAMNMENFAKIVSTKSYSIPPTNKYYETRYLNNTNKFVCNASSTEYFNKFVTGVKTSYVSNDDCGIAVTYRNGNTNLLCLTSGSPYTGGLNYANEDTRKLLEYGKQYHTSVQVTSKDEIMAEVKVPNGKEDNKLLLVAPEELHINLPKGYDEEKLSKEIITDKKVKAPITKGDALGQLNIYYNGEKYGSTILVADQSISSAPIKGFFAAIGSIFTSWIFITLVVLIVGLFIFYTILVNRARRRRKYVSRFRDLQ